MLSVKPMHACSICVALKEGLGKPFAFTLWAKEEKAIASNFQGMIICFLIPSRKFYGGSSEIELDHALGTLHAVFVCSK